MDRGCRLRRYFSSEFRCSHLWFVHEDWRPFAHTPWLPYWWRVQWLYPVYRCTLSFYFLVWLVYLINKAHFYGRLEQYFSLLTNWCFILWNLYLVVSAVTVSANQLCCHSCWWRRGKEGGNKSKIVTRKLCCSCEQDRSKLCDKLSWLLFKVSAEMAVAISLLYWTILSKNQDSSLMTSAGNLHVHLINGIVALLDLWIVGLPIHILHFLYTFLCALCYVAFTGAHHVTTNTTTTSRLYQVPRRPAGSEKRTALQGMVVIIPSLLLVGWASSPLMLYSGLLLYSFAAASVVTCLSSIASQFGEGDEKGKVMGIFRSLGALARALGPVTACTVFWSWGACVLYMVGAVLILVPLAIISLTRPPPAASKKEQ